jgi:hypothetical protein
MATEQDRKKRGLFLILGIAALLLLAAFAYNSGWLEGLFGAPSGGAVAAASGAGADAGSGAGDGGGGETAASSNGCFLGIICLNGSANADGTTLDASANDEGVNVTD